MDDQIRAALMAELRAAREKVEEELTRLDDLLAWLGSSSGPPAPSTGRVGAMKKPRENTTRDYIEKTMRDGSGGLMSVDDIYAGMKRLGWKTEAQDPRVIVYTYLYRMKKAGVLKQLGKKFKLPA